MRARNRLIPLQTQLATGVNCRFTHRPVLHRESFKRVLLAHTFYKSQKKLLTPNARALRMVFLASAIPFIGFGFLDNFIMLTVGEEIDAVFGGRLGLSTLASAGLGNLVSSLTAFASQLDAPTPLQSQVADAVGVGAANGIEVGRDSPSSLLKRAECAHHRDAERREEAADHQEQPPLVSRARSHGGGQG